RKNFPFQYQWAFFGGFIDKNEEPLVAAQRELEEEASLTPAMVTPLNFLSIHSGENRDPRAVVTTHVFYTFIKPEFYGSIKAADDVLEASWLKVDQDGTCEEKLAF